MLLANAAVVYLVQSRGCDIKPDIIFLKTRLSPTSKTTIPRLELMAVVIGVRCLYFINSQIQQIVSAFKLFTDSQCTLKWLESKKQLPVFVRNRIQEIKKSKEISFEFVKSKENAADLASRGCTMDKLVNNYLWWNGPEWLQKPNSTPPYEQEILDNPNEEAFQKDSSLQEWNKDCHLSKITIKRRFIFPARILH